MANINQAIELSKVIKDALGGKYFPALTGGALYKEGERKDIDFVIYRHRENPVMDMIEVAGLLEKVGFTDFRHYGWCTKCNSPDGASLDLFDPEACEGVYVQDNVFNL